MAVFTFIAAAVAVVAGILIAACSKKSEGVEYGKLDKAGRITNILLLLLYIAATPFFILLGALSEPDHTGLLGVLGWIVGILINSYTLFGGIGLGLSVALRKKGKSKASFIVQFAGVAGAILSFVLFLLFDESLMISIN